MVIKDANIFDELQQRLAQKGPAAAIEQMCSLLRERKDYANLFYALLLKKRYELGVSPIPTAPSQDLPESVHEPYESAIRDAARLVGNLLLEERNIPQAWAYFRMIGEPGPVAEAIEKFVPGEEEDIQPVVEVAYHHQVNPKKGFDWILKRFGICNAITTVTGQDTSLSAEVRDYCLKRLVHALYEELGDRLKGEIERKEGSIPQTNSIRELMKNRDWLFEEGFYHIDISHLSTVVQMSVYLPPGEELGLAVELCEYGQRLSPQFHQPDPPFDDQYRDYRIYLSALTGVDVEQAIEHFRAKVAKADPENEGTRPAEALVNLLMRLDRSKEALAVARQNFKNNDGRPMICPTTTELCQRASDYQTLAEVAREQADPVNYLAGLLLTRKNGKGNEKGG
jgi:hypothetical protein